MVQKSVIVVTPYQEFGELVSHSLYKNMAWKTDVVCTMDGVQGFISNYHSLDYALLDMEFGFKQVRESIYLIRDHFPSTEITLISRKEPPEEAENLRPWKLLTKPFIESDLLELFKLSSETKSDRIIEGNWTDDFEANLPAWARDRIKINNILTNSIVNLDAEEIILFADHKVLAKTATIQASDVNSCSDIVYKYLDATSTSEVIKQIDLHSTAYMLHATIIAVGLILAILYQPNIPYQEIRYQTRFLEASLVSPRLSTFIPKSLLIGKVGLIDESTGSNHMVKSADQTGQSKEEQPPSSLTNYARTKDQEIGSSISRGTDSPISSLRNRNDKPEKGPSYEALFSKVGSRQNRLSSVRPIYNLSHLYYSCLLIPRIRSHHITNDLYRFLKEEIPPIFPANGWRLESLIIDEHYMMWIALIPPTIAPTAHIKTIRKVSSKIILQNFTKFGNNGMISDFWAPGCYLEPGNQGISDRDIMEFINANRKQYYPDDGDEKHLGSKYYSIN